MKQIKLGNTDFKASAVALGIMRMKDQTVAEATRTLIAAHEAGINYIDSANVYGMGQSEITLGKAMKEAGLTRDDFFIQSKAGIVHSPLHHHGYTAPGDMYDFSRKNIIDEVDAILQRMDIDYLDAFLLHRPDPLMELDEVAATFDELQSSGKVRHFGVSNFNPLQFDLLQSGLNQQLMFNQLQFSLMHTGAIDFGMHTNMTDPASVDHDGGIIEHARLHHVTIQAWSPFQHGMLEGTFINNPDYPELNAKLADMAERKGVSKNAIAVAWILRHPAHMQVIIGTMNPDHIKDSAVGADVELTRSEWYELYVAAGHDLP